MVFAFLQAASEQSASQLPFYVFIAAMVVVIGVLLKGALTTKDEDLPHGREYGE